MPGTARITRVEKKVRDRLPSVLAAGVSVISFGVYLMTLSPGISWSHHSEDSGDLITAAWLLGIPHPTGYPLYCMAGWLWSHILPFGSVAWRMNAFSALWGALSAGIMVRATWRSFSLLSDTVIQSIGRPSMLLASVSAGFLVAFGKYLWEQSVVSEVYSLNFFFVSLISWILIELLAGRNEFESDGSTDKLLKWERHRGRLIGFLGLSWGFALTNHMTSMFLAASILVVLIFGNLGMKPKEFFKGAVLWFLPLLLYLYLPIRSAMNPRLDYGNPQTLDNFIWMVTGKQFKRSMFSLLPYQSLSQIMKYNSLPVQIGALGALAAGMGAIRLLVDRSRHVTILAVHSLLMVAVSLFFLASYSIWDPEGYVLPMIWAAGLWAAWSIVLLIGLPGKWKTLGKAVAIVLLVLAPIGALVVEYPSADLSADHEAMRFGEESFAAFAPNAVVIEFRYERAFVFWYYREIEYSQTRNDVDIVYIEHTIFPWGLDLLRRKYPNLSIPDHPLTGTTAADDTAAYIVRHNIGTRPIYTGKEVNVLKEEGYRFEAVGLMYRVYPPGE